MCPVGETSENNSLNRAAFRNEQMGCRHHAVRLRQPAVPTVGCPCPPWPSPAMSLCQELLCAEVKGVPVIPRA